MVPVMLAGIDGGAARERIRSEDVATINLLYGDATLQVAGATSGRAQDGHAVLRSLGAHRAA